MSHLRHYQFSTIPLTYHSTIDHSVVCPKRVEFEVSFSAKLVTYDIMIVTIIERIKWSINRGLLFLVARHEKGKQCFLFAARRAWILMSYELIHMFDACDLSYILVVRT